MTTVPDPDRDFWITTGLIGFFAGLSRVLYGWDAPFVWQRVMGKLMTSVLVAGIMRLWLWETLRDSPTKLLAITAMCGWLGADMIDVLLRRFILFLRAHNNEVG